MTADVIQLRDYQSKKDLARMYGETMEQQAIGIVDYINGLIPYGGAGIDGMPVSEPGMSGTDRFDRAMGVLYPDATQANAFHAPTDDPA